MLILLTVSDDDEETRIRALLKDIPRGTQSEEISKAGKYRNSWMNLRTEIENFMVAITLFLVKTMLDDWKNVHLFLQFVNFLIFES